MIKKVKTIKTVESTEIIETYETTEAETTECETIESETTETVSSTEPICKIQKGEPFKSVKVTETAKAVPLSEMDAITRSKRRCIRKATERDRDALMLFYSLVYGGNEAEATEYVNLVCDFGRTYVYDIGTEFAFIVSALTIFDTKNGWKYAAFGGTIIPLRHRGLFSDLLDHVKSKEIEPDGNVRIIFSAPTERNRLYLKKRGFTFEAYALECYPTGITKKKTKLLPATFAGCTCWFLREDALGSDGVHDEVFNKRFNIYFMRGGHIARFKEGYIAFTPHEEMERAYVIDECALSTESFLALPFRFERCILPMDRKTELEKAKISFEVICNAVATFPIEDININRILN